MDQDAMWTDFVDAFNKMVRSLFVAAAVFITLFGITSNLWKSVAVVVLTIVAYSIAAWPIRYLMHRIAAVLMLAILLNWTGVLPLYRWYVGAVAAIDRLLVP